MPPASAIAHAFFGRAPDTLTRLEGLGSVNQVFHVLSRKKAIILRLPQEADRTRAGGFYAKETWCLEQAAALGIPGPRVLALGQYDGWPYQIQSLVAGTPGTASPALWVTLGEYARRTHSTVLDGFGESIPDFFAGEGRAGWQRFVDYNVASLTDDDPLRGQGVYGATERDELRARFAALRDWTVPIGLCHGDLAPRNTLVAPDGTVALLDWGCAEAHLVPHYELLGIPPEALGSFLEGYGIPEADRGTLLQDTEALRLLKSFDLTRWAIDRCPARLEELATRARQTWAAVKDTTP